MKNRILFISAFLLAFTASGQVSLDQLLSKYNSHSIPYISVEELKMLQQYKDKNSILFHLTRNCEKAVPTSPKER